MFFHFFYQWASLAVLLASVGVAFWRGGWPERVGGGSMILAWLGTGLLYNSIQLHGAQVGPMMVDLLLLAVLLFIALRSDRWWPMWACAFQALNVVLHLALMADAVLWRRAAFIASSAFSYLVLLALLFGALSRPRRVRPTGAEAGPDAASPLT